MMAEGPAAPLRELGEILRENRLKRGWSLEEVAQRTKIPAHHIAAMESGDLSKMPANVYARGFIRSYASALEISEEPLMQKLDESGILSATALRRPPAAASSAAGPSRVPLRIWLAAGGIIILGAAIGFGIRGLFKLVKSSGEEAIPPSPFSIASKKEALGKGVSKARPPAMREAAARKEDRGKTSALPAVRVSVTASEECWMQVQVDDAKPVDLILFGGESRHWAALKKLRILAGNSGGIRMASAGGPIELPRRRGRVVHLLLTSSGEQRLEVPAISGTLASVFQGTQPDQNGEAAPSGIAPASASEPAGADPLAGAAQTPEPSSTTAEAAPAAGEAPETRDAETEISPAADTDRQGGAAEPPAGSGPLVDSAMEGQASSTVSE